MQIGPIFEPSLGTTSPTPPTVDDLVIQMIKNYVMKFFLDKNIGQINLYAASERESMLEICHLNTADILEISQAEDILKKLQSIRESSTIYFCEVAIRGSDPFYITGTTIKENECVNSYEMECQCTTSMQMRIFERKRRSDEMESRPLKGLTTAFQVMIDGIWITAFKDKLERKLGFFMQPDQGPFFLKVRFLKMENEEESKKTCVDIFRRFTAECIESNLYSEIFSMRIVCCTKDPQKGEWHVWFYHYSFGPKGDIDAKGNPKCYRFQERNKMEMKFDSLLQEKLSDGWVKIL